ncbi:N-acetyl-gamma-glutamyl-phosphate reductase [Clostridium cylindrosporum]|uniref:N-acetyl-gamma-glutamyl-phosphate reductase n=1 Tax=Clostridium cylindrosporum DSM 605 TaxID=1121307 RepID=A0A0J8G4Q3_CLOCY|nr:N-acetyl-gamma-glutamyl-phosphate reductase [Clostridium cylindrosporum]KMT22656.1 N-acetyl-gamma-glutamyl-phosphate reductase ArgC [Clostridium cylindrosporum DSM 605]
MIKVGIVGATGYAGQQLYYILNNHKNVEVKYISAHSSVGVCISELYGNYSNIIQQKCIGMEGAIEKLDEIDVVFLALPHGTAFDLVEKAYKKGVKVIDLGADYRIDDAKSYETWYNVEHKNPELIEEAVYGLCEINRDKIKDSSIIANPGCYTTASILAMYPLIKHGIVDEKKVIIDAASGTSGAGRSGKIDNLFCEVNENYKAYGVTNHRHTPEIEQELTKACGSEVLISFTPHLVPMNRGILATCYGFLKKDVTHEEIKAIYEEEYGNERFIRLLDTFPQTRWVRGTNLCDISFKIDERTGRIVVISAIDNLVKGAAGQAVQNMNIIFGLDEAEGIDNLAMAP